MLNLKPNPTLTDIQNYVTAMELERGFSNMDIMQSCLILGEEIGELFKAVRQQQRIK